MSVLEGRVATIVCMKTGMASLGLLNQIYMSVCFDCSGLRNLVRKECC